MPCRCASEGGCHGMSSSRDVKSMMVVVEDRLALVASQGGHCAMLNMVLGVEGGGGESWKTGQHLWP